MAIQKQSAKSKARKHATKVQREPVNPGSVRLVPGKGSKGRGGDAEGSYWHIYVRKERAGYVFINVINEPPFGQHASIQIKVNAKHRNRHIGRVAYRLA